LFPAGKNLRVLSAASSDHDIGHWQLDRHNALYYFINNADQYICMRYGGRDAEAAESYLRPFFVATRTDLKRH